MIIKDKTTFDNTYIVEDVYISELLDNLDSFKYKMDSFIESHSNYKYDIKIYKEEGIWFGEVKITKYEEQDD